MGMKKLQMPSSYAALPAEEQCAVYGGGEFGDAANNFFSNLHVDDFFFGGGLISFSFTFVPMLLFRMIKVGVQTGVSIYKQLTRLLGITTQTVSSTAQYLDEQQKTMQPRNAVNSFPAMLK